MNPFSQSAQSQEGSNLPWTRGVGGGGGVGALPAASLPEPALEGLLLTDRFTTTYGQTSFALSQVPVSVSGVQMYVNGQRQTPVDDFTVVGLTVTWTNQSFVLGLGYLVLVTYPI